MDVDVPFRVNPAGDDDSNSGDDSGHGSSEDEEGSQKPNGSSENLVPMPQSGGIQELRDKLHARMASLRRGGRPAEGGEPGSRDELIEERRRHRAAVREKRRKETKEKKKREEAAKSKKGKEKERNQGPTTKVRLRVISCIRFVL